MSTPILATKLYIPAPRAKIVHRPHLIERLNEGLQRKLTLISAPAGFGKSTLLSSWISDLQAKRASHEKIANPKGVLEGSQIQKQIAWLSLDEGDNDPARFLTYFVAALQTLAASIGAGLMAVLQSPQPPPTEAILTTLLNEITTILDNAATSSGQSFVLVLDDYHLVDTRAVDHALTFLLEHLPPQMHLVIATREDPQLPLARLRARGQLNELRVADLRFSHAEAAGFLNQVMGLRLSTEEVAALESRTEGWVAGLQLAAISMQGYQNTGQQNSGQQNAGQQNAGSFIQSFTGSHRFVMDYLVEEVLQQQSPNVQIFLLRTSILNRLCGPLCKAVVGKVEIGDRRSTSNLQSQATLEAIEQANLFIIPLDNERRWYRYHHLFAELLRQRLQQHAVAVAREDEPGIADLHIRASQWYEENGLELEAFQHATAANDIERAERLIAGKGIPLHFRGAVMTILDWLASLPKTVLDARPSLWWRYAALLLVNGQTTGVEEKLDAAEAALQRTVPDNGQPDYERDEPSRNMIGRIAAARATLALTRYQPDIMLTQSRRALEYLHPNNLSTRANANWTLGYAHFLQGERAAARRAYLEAISLSRAAGDIFATILPTIGLAQVQETENQLHSAAETYQSVLQMAGEQPLQVIEEVHLGLARIHYEWNELDVAEEHGRLSLDLARQYDRVVDRFIVCELFLARLKVAQGDIAGASDILAQADQSAHQKNFVYRIPEVAAVQVLTFLRQGNLKAAAHLAQTHDLPISQARVHLAQGNTSAARTVLEPLRQQAQTKGWADERLKVMVLQAVIQHVAGETEKAVHLLGEALALAEPEGFIRIFVDEGLPMAELLSEMAGRGIMPNYVAKLRAAFQFEGQPNQGNPHLPIASSPQALIEPLSQRELEVLQLIAQGYSNDEISQRLFLALSTVKGHNRIIFDKLQVQRRTEAVARGRELGLLSL